MPELAADSQPRLAIAQLLLPRKLSRSRSADGRCGPAGEFTVAFLCVLMAVAMHAVDAGLIALVLETAQLLHVAPVGRNETAPAGKFLHLIQDLALLAIADRDFAGATAFGPAVLEHQPCRRGPPTPAGS